MSALERRNAPSPTSLEARIAALEGGNRTAQSDLARRIEEDEVRLAALEKIVDRTAQIVAARFALDAGLKLGTIADAPPALAKFADKNPPTEAQLRLSFPLAARAALAASRPAREGEPLLARVWARAQDLVTIRRGDRVLVGNPGTELFDNARAALDAGDLAGAVAAVGALSGGAAQAMADWLAQARSLLDARAALASWASHH